MTVLVLAQHNHKTLHPSTLSALSAAGKVGEAVVLVAGTECKAVAESAAECEHVSKVLYADAPVFAHFLAEPLADVLMSVCGEEVTHVFSPATTFGKNVMPRFAALRGIAQVSDVIEVVDKNTYKRPIYAGNAIATVHSEDACQAVTVRPTAFEPVERKSEAAPIEKCSTIVENSLSEFVRAEQHNADKPQLDQADIVISGGRGLKDETGFSTLEQIADRMGAAFGASRAAVDAGLAPNDCQVGQTGKVVAPKLYIAVGISGAIQHIAGMKDSKKIVAINKDPDAPIFQIADYGLVADIETVLPEWEKTLDDMGL